MVHEEIIFLFPGRNYRIFRSSIVTCFRDRCNLLRGILFDDHSDRCADMHLGRSGFWLAIAGMYYLPCQWCAASVYRNCWRISVQDLSGSKASPNLYCQRSRYRETETIQKLEYVGKELVGNKDGVREEKDKVRKERLCEDRSMHHRICCVVFIFYCSYWYPYKLISICSIFYYYSILYCWNIISTICICC